MPAGEPLGHLTRRRAEQRGGQHRRVGRVVAELRARWSLEADLGDRRDGARRPRRAIGVAQRRRSDRWLVSFIAGTLERWTASDGAAQAPETAQTARRSSSAAAAGSAAPATLREAVTSADARAGEGRAEIVDGAALRADAGQQQDRTRHQLAQAGEEARLGRADDGARAAQLAGPGEPVGESRRPWRAIRSCRGTPSASRSSRSAAPAFEVRTRTKTPAPAAAARSTNGSSESAPSSGFTVAASAPRPRDRAPRGLGGAEERVAVGGGADRHVAALAVGDHQQARVAGRLGDLLQRRPAGRAERLEARELWLDRDAGGAGGARSAPGKRAAAAAAARSRGSPGPVARRRAPWLGVGDRVEPEADLAAALLDERREPVCERGAAGATT